MTWPLWMALLLVLSAMFAGAEAALFTLASSDPEDRPASANQLLRNPGSTLTLILIGNLLINLSYFGASAAWSAELSGSHAAFVALGAVLVLVVGAEIFPKVLAHRNPTRTGAWLLPPIRGLDFVFGRATRWLNQKMIRPRTPNSLTAQELRNLIRSEGANLLPDGEGDLLHRLLELDVLRAGAVRRPLADTPRVRGAVSLDLARQRLRERGVAWAAVEDAQSEIVGILDFGRLPEGDRVMDAMHPVPILPEVAPLARGVFLLRETGAPFVLLVDEYGSGAGVLERGRWADTLLDRASAAVSAGDGHRAIRRMSENRFAIDAGLPLHVFAKKFGDLGSVDPKVDTLAGWMSEKLAKVPEKGNRLMWRLNDTAVEFLVTQSQGARPSEIQVTFSTGSWNLPPEGGEA